MPASKNLATYKASMIQAIDRVASDPAHTPLVIQCDSEKQAKTFKIQFYGCRRALAYSDHPLKTNPALGSIQFHVNGKNLHVVHVDQTAAALDLELRVNNAIENQEAAKGSVG